MTERARDAGEVPEADALDQARDEVEADPPPVELGDVPEADALEQARGVRPPERDADEPVGDLPEADALEQRRDVGDVDDDRDR